MIGKIESLLIVGAMSALGIGGLSMHRTGEPVDIAANDYDRYNVIQNCDAPTIKLDFVRSTANPNRPYKPYRPRPRNATVIGRFANGYIKIMHYSRDKNRERLICTAEHYAYDAGVVNISYSTRFPAFLLTDTDGGMKAVVKYEP